MSGRAAETASRGRARTLTTPRGLFLTAALLLAALPLTSEIRDPDFWWHLRTGQLILSRHGLIATDPYTYTAVGHPWTMHEWLTEVLFAGLHAAGGLALIVVVLSVVSWLGVLFVFLRARLGNPHHLPLGLGVLLAVVSGYPVWGPRAQMITFALTCAVLLLVEWHLRRGGRAVWWLVPMLLVWSNLHSGFIIGIGFIVLVLLAEGGGHLLGLPGVAPASRLRSLALVLAACLVVVAVNPNGPGIYLYPFATQGSPLQQSLIVEWHSPDFHDASLRAFEVMLLSLAVMVVVNRRVRPRDAVLVLTTTALALQSVRHVALFVAAATPLWVEQADLTRQRIGAALASHRGRAAVARPVTAHPPLLFRVTATLTLVVLSASAGLKLVAAAAVREDSRAYATDYPVCAARWLLTAPGGLHIFNQYGEGGYLADRLSAHGDRVFIFGDAALMGDELLSTYRDVETIQPDWDAILRRSGTDLVLFDTGTPLAHVLQTSARWAEVYHDQHNIGFVPVERRGALNLPAQPATTAAGDPCANPDVQVAEARP